MLILKNTHRVVVYENDEGHPVFWGFEGKFMMLVERPVYHDTYESFVAAFSNLKMTGYFANFRPVWHTEYTTDLFGRRIVDAWVISTEYVCDKKGE